MGLESAVSEIVNFIKSLSSPVQIIGLLVIVIFIRKLVQSRFRKPPPPPREKPLEPMKKRDFTPQELLEYDGVKQKRVLLAVNFKVFDVTRGKDFYGPGGPYSVFAGHDASRGLATFSVGPDAVKAECDDLSDLNSMQMDSLREWETQFMEKYDMVGRLLKPDEKHQAYDESETEEEDGKGEKKEQ
ncbi:membrane-associated progesterone receptor component 2-like [Montipora foliosa]|uniref:membrane-associated progesterone receptor component 2-like n=1 Tax=Montipora foliosa TaxID=591990 RepID=UPI0035F215C9